MRFPFPTHDSTGLHYAVRILLGTAALWLGLGWAGDTNRIWAVISLIVVTEPRVPSAWLAFLSRMVHTILGCGVGLLFLLLAGPRDWILPVAATATVLVCTYLVRAPPSWRIGPVTAVLVIATDVADPSAWGGIEIALHRTGEVLLGSMVALLVTLLVARVWPMPDEPATDKEQPGPSRP